MQANWLYQATSDAQTHIVVHNGGSQSSKTWSILQYLFMTAASKKNKVITIVGQDIPNLKKGAIRDSGNIVPMSKFIESRIVQYNKSDHTYHFTTGSIIEFTAYDDGQDAKNGKRTHCFINEANGVSYDIFEQLRIRTSEKIIIDFNPSAEFWAHKVLMNRDDVTWINSTYRDNEFIEDTTKSAILSYEPTPENIKRGTANEYRWKVYGLGEVGRLEGLVFPDYEITATFPDEFTWEVYGMDFGFTNDPTTLINIRYAHGALYWRELLYETELTNPDISRRLAIVHDKKKMIVADSAEPKSIKELSDLGWWIEPAEKGADSINQGIDAIKRYPIFIHTKSKNLIDEFGSYTWAKDKNGNSTNKPIDKFNHGIDAGRYALSKRILSERKPLQAKLISF